MAEDYRSEIYKQHRDAQSRYTYFLLTASGAAIAFSVTQTQNAVLTWSMAPLGTAVLCWGLSFFCGCRYLTYVECTLLSNMELIQVQRGEHPETGRDAELVGLASEGIRSGMNANIETAARYGRNQFRFLIAGAVLFVVWHVLAMALRSPQVPLASVTPPADRPPTAASA